MKPRTELMDDLRSELVNAIDRMFNRLADGSLESVESEWLKLEENEIKPEHSASVGLRGDLKGSCFMIAVKEGLEETLIDLMGATSMPLTEQKKVEVSLNELTNMISGHVFSLLHEWYNYEVEFTAPVYQQDCQLMENSTVESLLKLTCDFEEGELDLYFLFMPE